MKRSVKSAGKFTALENSNQINAEMEEMQARIRQRAFEISTMRGHAAREVDDWLSAESEIISVPPVEVVERDNTYFVQVAIAGVDSNDLEVIASGNQVLIKADFRHRHEEKGDKIHVCDFRSAVVFRRIDFPESIDLKTIELEFRDGLLRLTVYKEGVAQARRSQKAAGEKPAKPASAKARAKAKG